MANTRLFAGTWNDDLYVYDVASDGTLSIVNSYTPGDNVRGLAVKGNVVVTAGALNGVQSWLDDGSGNLSSVTVHLQSGSYEGVWMDDSYVYCAASSAGVHIYSYNSTTAALTYVSTVAPPSALTCKAIFGDDTFLYVGTDGGYIWVYEKSGGSLIYRDEWIDPSIREIQQFGKTNNGFLLAANGASGIRCFEVSSGGSLTLKSTGTRGLGESYYGVAANVDFVWGCCSPRYVVTYTVSSGGVLTSKDIFDIGADNFNRATSNGDFCFSAWNNSGVAVFSADTDGIITNDDSDDQGGSHVWVAFEYNPEDEDAPTEETIIDRNIYIYRWEGTSNTQGELQAIIFYDRVLQGVGYHMGGIQTDLATFVDTIEELNFDTMLTSVKGAVSVAHSFSMTINNSDLYLYTGGGYTGVGTCVNSIDKYDVSSETSSALGGTLSSQKYLLGGGGSNTDGYFIGGRDNTLGGGAGTIYKTNDKLSYATETVGAVLSLTTGLNAFGSASNRQVSNYIYMLGGSYGNTVATASPTNQITRYDMVNNTKTEPIVGNVLTTVARQLLVAKMSQTHVYAFGGKGVIGASNSTNYIDKFSLANDTVTAVQASSLMMNSDTLQSAFYRRDDNTMLVQGGGFQYDGTLVSNAIFTMYEKFDCNTDTDTVYLTQRTYAVGNPAGTAEI